MDGQLLDLGFAFSEQLDIAMAQAGNEDLSKLTKEITTCNDLVALVLELLGTFSGHIYLESTDKERQKISLHYLYRIALGLFEEKKGKLVAGLKPDKALSKKCCRLIYEADALGEIVRLVNTDLNSLEEIGKGYLSQ